MQREILADLAALHHDPVSLDTVDHHLPVSRGRRQLYGPVHQLMQALEIGMGKRANVGRREVRILKLENTVAELVLSAAFVPHQQVMIDQGRQGPVDHVLGHAQLTAELGDAEFRLFQNKLRQHIESARRCDVERPPGGFSGFLMQIKGIDDC